MGMTVEQLIKRLQKLSPNLKVCIEGGFDIDIRQETTPYGQNYLTIRNTNISDMTRAKLPLVEKETREFFETMENRT